MTDLLMVRKIQRDGPAKSMLLSVLLEQGASDFLKRSCYKKILDLSVTLGGYI
jgi:hypothetical protein